MGLQLNVGSLTSGSGIDVQSTVDQLMSLQRAPLTQLQQQQTVLQSQTSALTGIQDKLDNLRTAEQALADFTGGLTARTVTSSQSSAISATADSSATISQHQISVDHIANGSSWYSNPYRSGLTFSAGSFQVELGSNKSVKVTVNQGDTLQMIEKTINGLSAGVTANVITDANGSRLTIISNNTGAANEITLSSDTVGFGFKESAGAKNASITVDGVLIDSASNTISTVIPGVTLTINSATNGTAVLNVQSDTSQARQAITNFVNAYNSAILAINNQFVYDTVSKTSGPLAADSTLRTIQQQVEAGLNFQIAGNSGILTLYDVGIEMQNDGTLTLDTGTLESALASSLSAVQNFFQSITPEGFCSTFDKLLNAILDPIDGSINVDLKGISDTNTGLQNQIEDVNDRLNTEEQFLLSQFEQVDALLRSYPTTMNQIDAILGSLPSVKGKASS